MSKRERADLLGVEPSKIAKTGHEEGVGVTNNPISAYPDDDGMLPPPNHQDVPPPLPAPHDLDDSGEPTALTHMTAAAAVDVINEVVQEAGILNDTEYSHHEHQHVAAAAGVPNMSDVPPALPGYDPVKMVGAKNQKDRTEFTAEQKLQILAELDSEHPPSIQSLIQKWGVSKSSLHRWKQPAKRERLQEMVGGAQSKLKRDMNDKFAKLKDELRRFCTENAAKPEAEQYEINSPFIQIKTREIRDDLLRRHDAEPFLEEKEIEALKHFQGSKSWACVTGNELGYLSANKGENAIVWSEKAKANTAAYLHQMRPPPAAKKTRAEFTAQEKLRILKEMEAKDPDKPNLTVKQICQKYNTSKSSLHRWQQAYKSGKLQEAVDSNGMGNAKRIFRDKLNPIKAALHEFVKKNESLPYDKQTPLIYSTLQHEALEKKNEMLRQHEAENNLTADEVEALQNFKASNSWLRETARRMGWQLAFVEGQKGAPLIPEYQYDPAAAAYQQQYGQGGHVAASYDMQQQQQQAPPQYGENQAYESAAQGQQNYATMAQNVETAPAGANVGETGVAEHHV